MNERHINLVSDTVTKPTKEMREIMANALVGDDVFSEDPSVNALQEMAADMFGKEAALFCPSGTMTNQIAIKVHTNPLDEMICDVNSHVYQYETGGYGFHSGIGVNLIEGKNGKFTAEQLKAHIKPVFDWLPISKLVVVENSCNKGGGSYYTLDEIKPIRQVCDEHKLKLHLDGARLFNVLVETGESTNEVGKFFDSISICLSKGLGAPVGSLLIGERDFIREARRFRKVMGGGMRQAGIIASAGQYALEHHVDRLKEDNDRAKRIGKFLASMTYVKDIRPVQTNILVFDLKEDYDSQHFMEFLAARNILCKPISGTTMRFVTHLDFTEDMMEELFKALQQFG
jgi:threonine aldolase